MLLGLILIGLLAFFAGVVLLGRSRFGRWMPRPVVGFAGAWLPVIVLVLVLRSFIIEPFRIPSGSMLPTLFVGDLIMVNKFVYGLRLPVWHHKFLPIGRPEAGDVAVFRYPPQPELHFIKRVVGVPGDVLSYRDKRLHVNGEAVELEAVADFADGGRSYQRRREILGDPPHDILIDPHRGARQWPEWTVPDGHYFVMGDNRDHSNDSRFWNFVPEDHMVGKAFIIWFNLHGHTGRVGEIIY